MAGTTDPDGSGGTPDRTCRHRPGLRVRRYQTRGGRRRRSEGGEKKHDPRGRYGFGATKRLIESTKTRSTEMRSTPDGSRGKGGMRRRRETDQNFLHENSQGRRRSFGRPGEIRHRPGDRV